MMILMRRRLNTNDLLTTLTPQLREAKQRFGAANSAGLGDVIARRTDTYCRIERRYRRLLRAVTYLEQRQLRSEWDFVPESTDTYRKPDFRVRRKT